MKRWSVGEWVGAIVGGEGSDRFRRLGRRSRGAGRARGGDTRRAARRERRGASGREERSRAPWVSRDAASIRAPRGGSLRDVALGASAMKAVEGGTLATIGNLKKKDAGAAGGGRRARGRTCLTPKFTMEGVSRLDSVLSTTSMPLRRARATTLLELPKSRPTTDMTIGCAFAGGRSRPFSSSRTG